MLLGRYEEAVRILRALAEHEPKAARALWYLGFALEGLDRLDDSREALEEGLIVNNVRPNAVRMAPSLTVSEAEIDEAVTKLEKAIMRASAA